MGKDSASARWATLGSHHASCKLYGSTDESCAAVRCVLDGPMRASCPNITVHEMGPYKGLGTRASRPLWANSSSSARSVHSLHGPTSAAILLAANYMGPHDSLVQQPVVCIMGQCDHFARQHLAR